MLCQKYSVQSKKEFTLPIGNEMTKFTIDLLAQNNNTYATDACGIKYITVRINIIEHI